MSIVKLHLVILTCDQRENITLKSVKNSDWSGEINVVKDAEYTKHKVPFYRVQDAFRGVLEDFLKTDADYLIYLEDDVVVNKHLEHNIRNFPILNEVNWLVLCDFGDQHDGYVITEERTTAGAQGLVISRRAAESALSFEWLAQFDKFVPRTLRDQGVMLHRYIPSIVQHGEGLSAIGGEPTKEFSPDYDPDYKADIV